MNDFKIINTNENEWDKIIELYNKITTQHGKNGYRVWGEIDETVVENDIKSGNQYKIVQNGDILCIFTIQQKDDFIWREKEQGDAIYLHRIVVNTDYRGQKQFEKVLNWTKQYALERKMRFVRMDTWADNTKLIEYYKTFGFEVVEYYKTPNELHVPIQYRNLDVILFEMDLKKIITKCKTQ